MLSMGGDIGLNIFIIKHAYIQHTHTKLKVDWVGSRSLLENPLQGGDIVVKVLRGLIAFHLTGSLHGIPTNSLTLRR